MAVFESLIRIRIVDRLASMRPLRVRLLFILGRVSRIGCSCPCVFSRRLAAGRLSSEGMPIVDVLFTVWRLGRQRPVSVRSYIEVHLGRWRSICGEGVTFSIDLDIDRFVIDCVVLHIAALIIIQLTPDVFDCESFPEIITLWFFWIQVELHCTGTGSL